MQKIHKLSTQLSSPSDVTTSLKSQQKLNNLLRAVLTSKIQPHKSFTNTIHKVRLLRNLKNQQKNVLLTSQLKLNLTSLRNLKVVNLKPTNSASFLKIKMETSFKQLRTTLQVTLNLLLLNSRKAKKVLTTTLQKKLKVLTELFLTIQ